MGLESQRSDDCHSAAPKLVIAPLHSADGAHQCDNEGLNADSPDARYCSSEAASFAPDCSVQAGWKRKGFSISDDFAFGHGGAAGHAPDASSGGDRCSTTPRSKRACVTSAGPAFALASGIVVSPRPNGHESANSEQSYLASAISAHAIRCSSDLYPSSSDYTVAPSKPSSPVLACAGPAPHVPMQQGSATQALNPHSLSPAPNTHQFRPLARMLAVSEHCPAALAPGAHWSLSDFQLDARLGESLSSIVLKAYYVPTGACVVLKVYFKSRLNGTAERQVRREVMIHSQMHHPHIIDFYGAFEDDYHFVLVLEYASQGDLFDRLRRQGQPQPEEEVVKDYIKPCLSALAYMHSKQVLHRDIKLENCFLSADGSVKIGDLGLAIDTSMEPAVQCLGTLDCMSPEVLCRSMLPGGSYAEALESARSSTCLDGGYDHKVDTWALGVMCYELLVHSTPFARSAKEATVQAILCSEPYLPDHVSPAAQDFVRLALSKDVRQRPNTMQLLRHSWIAPNTISQRPRSMCRLFDPSGCPRQDVHSLYMHLAQPNSSAGDQEA